MASFQLQLRHHHHRRGLRSLWVVLAAAVLVYSSRMVVAEQQPVVSDATTYYPHGFSSSSQLLQLPPDAHTVLVNLDAFAALFVEYHSCVMTPSVPSNNNNDNDMDENDYWYQGGTLPVEAQVTFSLYGVPKNTNGGGTSGVCSKRTFVNSYVTNAGFTSFTSALGLTTAINSASSAQCQNSYQVVCQARNSNQGFFKNWMRGSSSSSTFVYAQFSSNNNANNNNNNNNNNGICNSPNQIGTLVDRLDSFNQELQNSSGRNCRAIYDATTSDETTVRSLLSSASSCGPPDLLATTSGGGQCPDPYGVLVRSQVQLERAYAKATGRTYRYSNYSNTSGMASPNQTRWITAIVLLFVSGWILLTCAFVCLREWQKKRRRPKQLKKERQRRIQTVQEANNTWNKDNSNNGGGGKETDDVSTVAMSLASQTHAAVKTAVQGAMAAVVPELSPTRRKRSFWDKTKRKFGRGRQSFNTAFSSMVLELPSIVDHKPAEEKPKKKKKASGDSGDSTNSSLDRALTNDLYDDDESDVSTRLILSHLVPWQKHGYEPPSMIVPGNNDGDASSVNAVIDPRTRSPLSLHTRRGLESAAAVESVVPKSVSKSAPPETAEPATVRELIPDTTNPDCSTPNNSAPNGEMAQPAADRDINSGILSFIMNTLLITKHDVDSPATSTNPNLNEGVSPVPFPDAILPSCMASGATGFSLTDFLGVKYQDATTRTAKENMHHGISDVNKEPVRKSVLSQFWNSHVNPSCPDDRVANEQLKVSPPENYLTEIDLEKQTPTMLDTVRTSLVDTHNFLSGPCKENTTSDSIHKEAVLRKVDQGLASTDSIQTTPNFLEDKRPKSLEFLARESVQNRNDSVISLKHSISHKSRQGGLSVAVGPPTSYSTDLLKTKESKNLENYSEPRVVSPSPRPQTTVSDENDDESFGVSKIMLKQHGTDELVDLLPLNSSPNWIPPSDAFGCQPFDNTTVLNAANDNETFFERTLFPDLTAFPGSCLPCSGSEIVVNHVVLQNEKLIQVTVPLSASQSLPSNETKTREKLNMDNDEESLDRAWFPYPSCLPSENLCQSSSPIEGRQCAENEQIVFEDFADEGTRSHGFLYSLALPTEGLCSSTTAGDKDEYLPESELGRNFGKQSSELKMESTKTYQVQLDARRRAKALGNSLKDPSTTVLPADGCIPRQSRHPPSVDNESLIPRSASQTNRDRISQSFSEADLRDYPTAPRNSLPNELKIDSQPDESTSAKLSNGTMLSSVSERNPHTDLLIDLKAQTNALFYSTSLCEAPNTSSPLRGIAKKHDRIILATSTADCQQMGVRSLRPQEIDEIKPTNPARLTSQSHFDNDAKPVGLRSYLQLRQGTNAEVVSALRGRRRSRSRSRTRIDKSDAGGDDEKIFEKQTDAKTGHVESDGALCATDGFKSPPIQTGIENCTESILSKLASSSTPATSRKDPVKALNTHDNKLLDRSIPPAPFDIGFEIQLRPEEMDLAQHASRVSQSPQSQEVTNDTPVQQTSDNTVHGEEKIDVSIKPEKPRPRFNPGNHRSMILARLRRKSHTKLDASGQTK